VGFKFSKCLNQTSLICVFKAFGVILLDFKVEKFNQGVILQTVFYKIKKKFEGVKNESVGLPEPHIFFYLA
jgi:hypothetical protein